MFQLKPVSCLQLQMITLLRSEKCAVLDMRTEDARIERRMTMRLMGYSFDFNEEYDALCLKSLLAHFNRVTRFWDAVRTGIGGPDG